MKISEILSGAYAGGSVKISNAAIAEALERKAKAAQEQAAERVAALVDEFEDIVKASVYRLREYRKAEREQAKRVANMDMAFRFFGETGNPMPMFKAVGNIYGGHRFCAQVGADVPDIDDAIWNVPDDWKPAE